MTDDLLGFVSSMGGERALRVEESLGEGYVRLRVAEAERRQAKHDIRCVEDAIIEMLRNARDADAHHIYVATTREGDLRTTTILDDGVGIPRDMHERIFEARVTSKLDSVHMDRWGIHGRGMALFSILENSVSAEVVSSAPGKGSSIRVVTNVSELPERADQSSWPSVERNDEGALVCSRGPHNIIRTCCEFALEERGGCEVYFGSPAEMVATARARVRPSVSASELLSLKTLEQLPVLERLHAAADAGELCEQAASLGLEMSERTAHRIVAGQISPQKSVLSHLVQTEPNHVSQKGEVDLARDRRSLRVSKDDLEDFSYALEGAFQALAERYYLSLSADPRISIGRDKITVTFDLRERD